jgi:hypothetical protein
MLLLVLAAAPSRQATLVHPVWRNGSGRHGAPLETIPPGEGATPSARAPDPEILNAGQTETGTVPNA